MKISRIHFKGATGLSPYVTITGAFSIPLCDSDSMAFVWRCTPHSMPFRKVSSLTCSKSIIIVAKYVHGAKASCKIL